MKKMYKILALVMAMVMMFSLCACSKEEAKETEEDTKVDTSLPEALQKIQKKGEIVLGTSADYPPYEFHAMVDGKDTIVGFDISIAQYVADSLGVDLKVVDMSFDNLIMSLAKDEFDFVVAAMNETPERAENADFSKAYLKGANLVLVRADEAENYKTLEDLKGKKSGAQKGSNPFERAVKYSGGEEYAVGLVKVQDIVMELKSGKIDTAYLDFMTAIAYDVNNEDLVAVDVGIPVEGEGYQIAVNKGNTDLKEYLNKIIDEIQEKDLLNGWIAEAQELSNTEE